MKRLATIMLTASVALGSVLAIADTTSAAPIPQPLTIGSSNIHQARVDDNPPYRWDAPRYYHRRHWNRDDRRYWHREHWRERNWREGDWRRDRYWRYRRGPAVILDF
ncbi:hypothetical protein [Neorhizobium sp. P12A]|uniref:hypothetical protein n=1 Tax=Neorhizobium sp. P12A TaxID=2268027 RepID=UPI0011EEBAC9|nr:hypothetical protein [Neorhizobium sp. P12A]